MPERIDPTFLAVQSRIELKDVQNYPCPVTWCDRHKIGHDFDSETADGKQLARTHGVDIGYLSNEPGPNGEAWVDVSATETLDETGSSIEVPYLVLSASYVRLTSEEARRVAGMLMAGADRLDAILGSKTAPTPRGEPDVEGARRVCRWLLTTHAGQHPTDQAISTTAQHVLSFLGGQ